MAERRQHNEKDWDPQYKQFNSAKKKTKNKHTQVLSVTMIYIQELTFFPEIYQTITPKRPYTPRKIAKQGLIMAFQKSTHINIVFNFHE